MFKQMQLVILYVKVSLNVQYIPNIIKPLTTEIKYTIAIQSLYIKYRLGFIMDCENVISLPLEACLPSVYEENVIMCLSRTQ